MFPTEALECLPVHSVLFAIGGKIIELRRRDRQLSPNRVWSDLLQVFGNEREAVRAKLTNARRVLDATMSVQPASEHTRLQAERLLSEMPWTGDPDLDIAALAGVVERYIARVPKEIVEAHIKENRASTAVVLSNEEDIRNYLFQRLAYMAEDVGGRFAEDRPS